VRRLTLLVVLVAFIFSCGGEWPILQGIAWVSMVREYSEMVPLEKAVQMTVSGEYPCALCKVIAEKKHSEDNKAVTFFKHEKKILSGALFVTDRRTTAVPQYFEVAEQFLKTRSESPPTPPPRLA
jgi:hypothetical protein